MFNLVKGTRDIILEDAQKFTYVENLLSKIAEIYGFNEFRTPIMEYTELFSRSTGESSDVVRKEMYTFLDKGNRSITLRPEVTAGVVRSMVNAKLFADQDFPVKAYYVGPNFRYERPQQGRYRQFNQFGIECVGVNSSFRDLEAIMLGYNCLKMLGFNNVSIEINSLGDASTQENYRKALKTYYQDNLDNMCDDCKERFNINVLRILDCKVEKDIEINKKAPSITDFYSDEAKENFNAVIKYLEENNVKYHINNSLVRGLDYYTGIVFEYQYTSSKGKNYGALGGGGHYGNLSKEIGGPDIEGVGFAFGIDRLVSVMEDDGIFNNLCLSLDCYVMPLGKESESFAYNLAEYLRGNGYSTDVCLEHKGLSQMFKKALRRNAKYAIILGEDEINNKNVKLKNLKTEEQITVNLDNLIEQLDDLFELNDEHHHI